MPPPLFFFFNDTATTEIYTLSLHDALPISESLAGREERAADEDEDDQQYNPEAEAPADQLLLHRQDRLASHFPQLFTGFWRGPPRQSSGGRGAPTPPKNTKTSPRRRPINQPKRDKRETPA